MEPYGLSLSTDDGVRVIAWDHDCNTAAGVAPYPTADLGPDFVHPATPRSGTTDTYDLGTPAPTSRSALALTVTTQVSGLRKRANFGC